MRSRTGRSRIVALLLAGATCLSTLPAAAQPTPPEPPPPPAAAPETPLTLEEAGHLLALDARTVLLAPVHWGTRGWERFGLVAAGVGAVALADRSIRDRELKDHSRTADDVARVAEPLGAGGAFVVLGGFYVGGLLSGDERAKDVAFDGAVSSLLAAGIISPVLKTVVGRSRPNQAASTFEFRPFRGGASFPSGHATEAFAVASVIATSYDSRWVAVGSYGVATLVGFARVHHQAHFASDVAAAAAIGTAVGRTVVRINRRDGTARPARVDARRTILIAPRDHGRWVIIAPSSVDLP
jgi:membrane-associated phospholipid phosphatase